MSKKATRRAARQAFPQARPSAAGPKRGRSGAGQSGRTKAGGARPLRPPSWKRAAIQGAVLAILYFVVIQYVWVPKDAAGNRTANVYASLLVAVVGFIAYTCIAYLVDRFTYNRRLRKLKGSGK